MMATMPSDYPVPHLLEVLWHELAEYEYRRDRITATNPPTHGEVAQMLARRYDLNREDIRIDAIREVDRL